jgi:hypothetical protein
VRITVNDERIPFHMKVGETGEAFFVFETEDDVPADMQTSPLAGPLSDDGRSDAGVGFVFFAVSSGDHRLTSSRVIGTRTARPGCASHGRGQG